MDAFTEVQIINQFLVTMLRSHDEVCVRGVSESYTLLITSAYGMVVTLSYIPSFVAVGTSIV